MIQWVKRTLCLLQDIIWPQKVLCLLCDEFSSGQWLCTACAQKLGFIRMKQHTGQVRSAYVYKGVARQLIHALKYDALRPAAAVLAEAMAEDARDMDLPTDTVITWVTTTRARQLRRGGDHGRELCTAVSERLGLPMRQLLVRTRRARTQRGLDARQRQTNLKGVFRCSAKLNGPVLVVDDVYTTGATLRYCTAALLEAGATAVYALTATKVDGEADPDEASERPRKVDVYGFYAAGMDRPVKAERQHRTGGSGRSGAGKRRAAGSGARSDAPSSALHAGGRKKRPG